MSHVCVSCVLPCKYTSKMELGHTNKCMQNKSETTKELSIVLNMRHGHTNTRWQTSDHQGLGTAVCGVQVLNSLYSQGISVLDAVRRQDRDHQGLGKGLGTAVRGF
jgi:hypothetical protein